MVETLPLADIFRDNYNYNPGLTMDNNGWNTVRRGRVRGAAQGPGPGGAGAGPSGGLGAGPAVGPRGPHHGGGRPRTQLRPSDTRANVNVRTNTVVMECQEFYTLPEEHEAALFLYEQVCKEDESKVIFKEVKSLFCDKNARRYLVKMNTPESTAGLAELLADGVSWPQYMNDAAGRAVIVKGYSMEKPVMDITISGVGWWTGQDVLERVLDTWGEVKKITKEVINIHGQNITTGKWRIKLVKKEGILIPPVVFHAGSERCSEEREMWEIYYWGVPKVCHRCLKPGHFGKDCKDDPFNLEQLASQPEYEVAPAAAVATQEEGVRPKTFAQIVAEPSYTNARVARQQAAEQKKEALAAKLREEKLLRDKRRAEKELKRKEKLEKKEAKTSESEGESEGEDNGGPVAKGFAINRFRQGLDWAHEMNQEDLAVPKRPAESPPALVPDRKTQRMTPHGSRTNSPVDPRRQKPPGN